MIILQGPITNPSMHFPAIRPWSTYERGPTFFPSSSCLPETARPVETRDNLAMPSMGQIVGLEHHVKSRVHSSILPCYFFFTYLPYIYFVKPVPPLLQGTKKGQKLLHRFPCFNSVRLLYFFCCTFDLNHCLLNSDRLHYVVIVHNFVDLLWWL